MMQKYSRKNVSARPAWQNSIKNPSPKPYLLANTCLLSNIKSLFYAVLRTFSAFSCNFFATLSVNPCSFPFHLMRVCVGAGAGGHGCTGKQKRNSIYGVSNSIKSKIWIKFNLSVFPYVLLGKNLCLSFQIQLLFCLWWWGRGCVFFSLKSNDRTVPWVLLHHAGCVGGMRKPSGSSRPGGLQSDNVLKLHGIL